MTDHGARESLALQVLRAGREEAPSFESRQRALAALGIGGATVTTATTAGAAAAGSGGTGMVVLAAKWAGIGLLLGATVTGFAKRDVLLSRAPESNGATYAARTARVTVETKTPPGLEREAALSSSATRPVEQAEETPSAVEERRFQVAPTKIIPNNGAPLAGEDPTEAASILREVQSLDAVKRYLDGHDPNGALAALDERQREFGRGALGPEALVLSIEAFAMKGDRPRVEALAEEFFAAYPKSPHADRVRNLAEPSTIP